MAAFTHHLLKETPSLIPYRVVSTAGRNIFARLYERPRKQSVIFAWERRIEIMEHPDDVHRPSHSRRGRVRARFAWGDAHFHGAKSVAKGITDASAAPPPEFPVATLWNLTNGLTWKR